MTRFVRGSERKEVGKEKKREKKRVTGNITRGGGGMAARGIKIKNRSNCP